MERVNDEWDKVLWKGSANSLASGFAILFPAKEIWVPSAPTKVTFFAWEAAWGKVLILDKLQRRG